MPIPIIDIFAGPGGLGEGFSSLLDNDNKRIFKIKLSIEKDAYAHQTLKLRSFFRQFDPGKVPADYYLFVKGQLSLKELYNRHPKEAELADKEAWCGTLGKPDEKDRNGISNKEVDKRIEEALDNNPDWLLIGGPPCQAYSLVGRSRRQETILDEAKDKRVGLYKEYLRIIAVHNPAVFVMENVKGILSAQTEDEYLCRLYTTGELIKWYKYITVASEELRAEFEEMKIQRKSPKTFGIKVRQSPDVLKITATNKMRSSEEMVLTYSDKLRETWCFSRDRTLINENYRHTFNFINSLVPPEQKNSQPLVWYNKNNSEDVVRFLQGYKADNRLEHQKIIEYICEQVKAVFLINWTIVLISLEKNKKDNLFKVRDNYVSLGLTMRSDAEEGRGNYYEISRSHIIDPKHEFIDFDINSDGYKEALDLTVQDWENSERINKSPEPPVVPSGKNIRAKRQVTEGLLLIYPLEPKPDGWLNSPVTDPIIGYAISFPKNDNDKKLKYKVNEVFMEEFDYEYIPEIDEINID